MRDKIRERIVQALQNAFEIGDFSPGDIPPVTVEETRHAAHGDFASNIAMVMAPRLKMAPRKIAEIIVSHLSSGEGVFQKIEIAGPGFINFFVDPAAWHPVLQEIHEKDTRYGAWDFGKGIKVQVEFVSANPTGPLHVGHGRGAAVGDSVANILSFCGYDVQKEYYINDSGRQIGTLGRSVFLRYRELLGNTIDFPEDCYRGDYIRDLAGEIRDLKADALLSMAEDQAVFFCARFAADRILSGIRNDLEVFGVLFDRWYSEQSLYDSGRVDNAIRAFRERGVIYEQDGALWFRTTDFGDEKDRVVVRQNGLKTYFASDIAYHYEKYERGFHRVIDVWGADHHGYIPRMTAAVEAMGHDRDRFHVILVQLVNLLRGGAPVAMSTRSGEFVTLEDVVKEVGRDAARFIFLTRHYESPLDFDLELAKQKTNDNPVYYVQYVHARISSISRKGEERGAPDIQWGQKAVASLGEPEELQLIKLMDRYPDIVKAAAELMEPHRITYYLMNLAAAFHVYYSRHRVLHEDPVLTQGRLYLVTAVQKVIRNGLTLLGVSAPEQM
jgi:arginyl-tRNA synthetase